MKNEMISNDLKVNRPEPIKSGVEIASFIQETDIQKTINALLAGEYILIKEFYSNGLVLLNELQLYLKKMHPNESFQEQREFRSEYRKLSNLILIQVKEHKLTAKKAPWIGWLEKLYPETNDFLLPFPQIQGLNSAWQWYINGVIIPVIRNKVHPYYGVYFPTRFEHLQLFDNWLVRYKGPKKSAINVGIGSGVLSLLLVKHGFQKSFGTDINPNAIIGLKESMEGTKLSRKIEIDYGHLFGKWEKQTELIVFNPPWLPASHDLDRLDEAIYYNDKLFPDFFEEAKKRLLPEGRIVLLFSNLGQITNATKEHPIEKELLNGSRFELDKCLKKSVKAASEKTKRTQHWRSTEEVELWVLKHK
ncbi:MAG: methyltransferase [Bacteroidetes bacterium]|nr:methyltransferase [Bacteroidota bacterium]MBL6943299.1 methyltransferase [Bacteroidales bacterium]